MESREYTGASATKYGPRVHVTVQQMSPADFAARYGLCPQLVPLADTWFVAERISDHLPVSVAANLQKLCADMRLVPANQQSFQ